MAVDWNAVVRAVLFAFFAGLTGLLLAVLGPTYDNLLVPSLAPGALFPPFPLGAAAPSRPSFLSVAVGFSRFLLADLVDPAIGLVAAAIGLLYLARASLGGWKARLEALLPRLVVAVVLANFTLPVTGGILDVAGAVYPVIAGLDGGAWKQWQNIGGFAGVGWSWDNGLLAFVVAFVLFSLVLLLITIVAVRNALLALLVVLLPLFTLLWPVPVLSTLARRAWLLFLELSFLPCVLVLPLELAVHAASSIVALAYLTVAVGSPYLISVAGSHLGALGFPGASGAVSGGIQRGLGFGALGFEAYTREGSGAIAARGRGLPSAIGATVRTAGKAPLPAGLPLAFAEAVGQGVSHLIHRAAPGGSHPRLPADRFPAVRWRERRG